VEDLIGKREEVAEEKVGVQRGGGKCTVVLFVHESADCR